MEGQMAIKDWILVGSIVLFLTLTSCVGPSRLEIDYGTSHKLATFNQILDPEAEKNLEPVTGFDGNAARRVVEKYQKDFEKPTPPPTYLLGVGTLGKE
jgi:hypothetical protein